MALIARALGERLPRGLGLALFGTAGRIAFLFPSPDRRRALAHLRLVYGTRWTEARIQAVARDMYRGLGKNVFDALHLASLDDERFHRIVRAEGLEGLQQAFARGKGLIAITAHTGCFEMQLGFFGRNGIRGFAIGRKLYDERLDAMVASSRNAGNVEYLYRSESPRVILRRLADGWAMGVLIDQDTRTDGVFAHFLGRLAFTPSAPVKMAMRYGLPLFVTTTARQADDTHLIRVSPELHLERTGDEDADLVRNVEMVNDLLSRAIDEHPEQWVWMHRRWRRRPQDPGMEGVLNIEKVSNHNSQVTNNQNKSQ